MRKILGLAALWLSVASAHAVVVHAAPARAGVYHPSVVVFARIHGPDHVVLKAPYDALMGPRLVPPGSQVTSGEIVARLVPASLAGTVRAQQARVRAAYVAYREAEVLVGQHLMTAARAGASKALWQADRATLAADTMRLARGVVRAPFAGTVRYQVAPGAWLTRGTEVASVAGVGHLYAVARLSSREAREVFVGSRAFDPSSGVDQGGRVYALATTLDHLGLVRAYVRGLKGLFRPGQVLSLTLLGHVVHGLAVPRAALLVSAAKPRVYIVASGRAQPVAVLIEHLGARYAWVQGHFGLHALVIDSHVSRLRAGESVRVQR